MGALREECSAMQRRGLAIFDAGRSDGPDRMVEGGTSDVAVKVADASNGFERSVLPGIPG